LIPALDEFENPTGLRRDQARCLKWGQNRRCRPVGSMSALPLPAQPVDATQALNLSAGLS
jgi:hypothetical protein